jgi:hypothetical protein
MYSNDAQAIDVKEIQKLGSGRKLSFVWPQKCNASFSMGREHTQTVHKPRKKNDEVGGEGLETDLFWRIQITSRKTRSVSPTINRLETVESTLSYIPELSIV